MGKFYPFGSGCISTVMYHPILQVFLLNLHRFLAITHNKQAYRSEDNEASDVKRHSLLSQMLPEAMVAYLENHGPEKFAQIFLGEYDTPEAIWNHEMRTFMIQKIAYHLADFSPRLKVTCCQNR